MSVPPDGRIGDRGTESPAKLQGERSRLLVAGSNSAQRRLANFLALLFAGLSGVAALTWYYTSVYHRAAQPEHGPRPAHPQQSDSEMVLPPLDIAGVAAAVQSPASDSHAAGTDRESSLPPTAQMSVMAPAEPALTLPTEAVPGSLALPGVTSAGSMPNTVAPGSGTRSPLMRRLSGPAFARASSTGSPGTDAPESVAGAMDAPGPTVEAGPPALRSSDLEAALRPSITPAVRARLLPTRALLLPKGAFLDCTLETAIDSSLPGMVTCITASDTFGADGRVVLLERGTKLVGETRGQVRQGASRVFVLWTEARTPTGVIVPLDSPGTDELGRAGLPGVVDRHFWQRFGAAILISVVDGAIQAAATDSGRGSTVVWGPSASQGVLTEILKDTIGIPPTVMKRNGDRIQVLVARDLDFRTVYELRASTPFP